MEDVAKEIVPKEAVSEKVDELSEKPKEIAKELAVALSQIDLDKLLAQVLQAEFDSGKKKKSIRYLNKCQFESDVKILKTC